MFNPIYFHPMIVHFPIALIIAGFFIDFVSLFIKSEKCLSKAGFYLMLLGTLGAIAAFSTGQLFTDHPESGDILPPFLKHKTAALLTMIVMIIGSAFRIWLVAAKKEESVLKWVAFGFYFLGLVTVSFTGYMGGILVYEFILGG